MLTHVLHMQIRLYILPVLRESEKKNSSRLKTASKKYRLNRITFARVSTYLHMFSTYLQKMSSPIWSLMSLFPKFDPIVQNRKDKRKVDTSYNERLLAPFNKSLQSCIALCVTDLFRIYSGSHVANSIRT